MDDPGELLALHQPLFGRVDGALLEPPAAVVDLAQVVIDDLVVPAGDRLFEAIAGQVEVGVERIEGALRPGVAEVLEHAVLHRALDAAVGVDRARDAAGAVAPDRLDDGPAHRMIADVMAVVAVGDLLQAVGEADAAAQSVVGFGQAHRVAAAGVAEAPGAQRLFPLFAAAREAAEQRVVQALDATELVGGDAEPAVGVVPGLDPDRFEALLFVALLSLDFRQ